MTVNLRPWAKSLKAFSDWINVENQTAGKAWLRRLKSDQSEQVESAVAEAVVWDFIGCRCDSTCLNESPGTGGVDFEFVVDGHSFLVEVTNISTEAASAASAMPNKDPFAGLYGCSKPVGGESRYGSHSPEEYLWKGPCSSRRRQCGTVGLSRSDRGGDGTCAAPSEAGRGLHILVRPFSAVERQS